MAKSVDASRVRAWIVDLLSLLRDAVFDVFTATLLLYLLLVVLEKIKRGFVSFFFNLDIMLGIVVVAGALTALTGGPWAKGLAGRGSVPRRILIAGAVGLGVAGAIAIYAETPAHGWARVVSSLAGGAAMGLLAWFLPERQAERDG
jgi:hypothetical protein